MRGMDYLARICLWSDLGSETKTVDLAASFLTCWPDFDK